MPFLFDEALSILLVLISNHIPNNMQQKEAVVKEDNEAIVNRKVIIQTLQEELKIYLTSFDIYQFCYPFSRVPILR